MKAVLKFLLNTGAGRMIVQAIVSLLIRVIKRKVSTLEGYKAENLGRVMDIIHQEIHADVETGKLKVTDLI